MVNWDRVEELRSKDWDWERIAADPKVGFHPDSSVREPGRALRALYHRQRTARQRQGPAPIPKKRRDPEAERRWTPIRLLWLFVPLVAIWTALAYAAPSPVGLIVPALPWLALALAALAFVLIFLLLRAEKRWTPVYRGTLIGGVVAGLLFAGMVGLVGALVFGCPYLPPASTLTTQPDGWTSGGMASWQDSGKPVVYYYGALWCPYCSASSWAIWDALRHFGAASPTPPTMGYSAEDGIPYVDLASGALSYSSSYISFQVSEDTSTNVGTFPTTSGCFQQAYFGAYGGAAIPFVAVNGQYVHGGSALISASVLQAWAGGAQGGTGSVYSSVVGETGTPWSGTQGIQGPTWWLMAFMAKSTGATASNLASQPYVTSVWTAADRTNEAADLGQIK